jgi:hypothetical protein
VELGLGETVQVGDGVLVGMRVAVFVLLGKIVRVVVGVGIADRLQAVRMHTVHTMPINRFSRGLAGNVIQGRNGEERVMITDFTL